MALACRRWWLATCLALGVLAGCQNPTWAPSGHRGALVVEFAPAQSRATGSVLYLERVSEPLKRAGGPRQVDVMSEGARFDSSLHVVRPGDDVRFVNRGTLAHRLFIADDEGRREQALGPGGSSKALRITRAGEHRFYCSLHPDEGFVLFASPSDQFIVPDGRRSHRIDDLPVGHYRLSWWSDAGVRSVGMAEVRAGQTGTLAISLGPASR